MFMDGEPPQGSQANLRESCWSKCWVSEQPQLSSSLECLSHVPFCPESREVRWYSGWLLISKATHDWSSLGGFPGCRAQSCSGLCFITVNDMEPNQLREKIHEGGQWKPGANFLVSTASGSLGVGVVPRATSCNLRVNCCLPGRRIGLSAQGFVEGRSHTSRHPPPGTN